MAAGAPRRTQITAVLDLLAVGASAAGLAVLSARLAAAVTTVSTAIAVTAMLAAGYVMADLVTGFVHWFCDTFFEEDTPVIGPALIASFREHHRDPLLMTRHSFLELTGSSFRGLVPFLALLVWKGEALPVSLTAFAFALSAGAVMTNFLHRWAHDPAPPAIARILQGAGLVLTPARHARHHAPPYEGAYCVTTGWMNPICERFAIWSRAEAAFRAAGLPINRGAAARPSVE